MNLVNCKASKPSNEPKKEKKMEKVYFYTGVQCIQAKLHTHIFRCLTNPKSTLGDSPFV